ncbi:MAG: protein tyrosine phosphatase family protein [Gemmatales bacterium]|nr:protein tyrosine phosphatase family protein [Gemmatales bacterium]MCS7160138.1 protein tyrosine phosphatase family protein [Gemmatales bacterium]MDW8175338.1 protein tyrosine phosphatase family protein [Gemmatales bacterium]MDW8224110.1 protein tyrosine phosphatase family protein [Gemmatales bacterium]
MRTKNPFCLAGVLVALWANTTITLAQEQRAAPEAVQCGKIAKLSRVANIYIGGQPTKEDFAELKKLGIKTILNLRQTGETALDEQALATEHGIRYVHLPFQKADELTDAVFDRVRQLLRDTKSWPIFVHCGSANRAAAVWLPYRVLDEGVSYDQAVKEAREMGLRSAELEQRARDYIARQLKK